jgi:hypothetical protein
MNTQISWLVYVLGGLGVVACLASMMIFVSVVYLSRKKIRKEWGLFKAHLKYRPDPPKKTLHF